MGENYYAQHDTEHCMTFLFKCSKKQYYVTGNIKSHVDGCVRENVRGHITVTLLPNKMVSAYTDVEIKTEE